MDPTPALDVTTSSAPPPVELLRTPTRPPPDLLRTLLSILQALLVSGFPTLMFVGAVLVLAVGMEPFEGGRVSLPFIATVMFLDTALVALLILAFLTLTGETSREVFIGPRSVAREMVRGLLLVPVSYVGVTTIVLLIRTVAPALHNVPDNPMTEFMQSPLDAAVFLVIVVLAGGVREELQRAFILHRFRHTRAGLVLALVLFSALFGLLHFDQGWDVVIGVGLLGFFWGVLYIRRRSAVLAMTNHAGFNAVQVVSVVLANALGM